MEKIFTKRSEISTKIQFYKRFERENKLPKHKREKYTVIE